MPWPSVDKLSEARHYPRATAMSVHKRASPTSTASHVKRLATSRRTNVGGSYRVARCSIRGVRP